MRDKYSANLNLTIFFSLIILLFSSNNIFSQEPEPLSLKQVEAFIENKINDDVVALELKKRGISFEISVEILDALKKRGAKAKTIVALNNLFNNTKSVSPASSKIKILITNFVDLDTQGDAVTEILLEELRKATKDYENVEIVSLNENINPQQGKEIAIKKGKERNVNIVLWGWYKKSASKVIFYPHIEITSEKHDIPNIDIRKQIKDISKLESFEAQLELSKDMFFFTRVFLGLVNFELEEFNSAIKYFSDALSQSPLPDNFDSLPEIYLYRALAKDNRCNPVEDEEILKDINKAISLGMSPTDSRIPLTFITKDRNKQIEILEKYLQEAKTDTDKLKYLLILSALHSFKDNTVRSKEYAQKAIDFIPSLKETSQNYLYLSISYVVLEDFEKFKFYFNKAKSLVGTDRKALYIISGVEAWLDYDDEKYDLAVNSFKKRIQIKPGCYNDYTDLARSYEKGNKFDLALNTYTQAIELSPKNADIYIDRARVYEEKREYEKALADYRKAIEIKPDRAESYYYLGAFFKDRKRLDEAVVALTKAISLDSNHHLAYEERAEIYKENGEHELAVADYEQSFRILFEDKSEDGKYYLKLSFYDLNFYKFGEKISEIYTNLGIKHLDKYLQLYPNDDWAHYYKTLYLEKRGDIAAVLEHLNKAIGLNPKNANYYKGRAGIYLKNKNHVAALSDYEKAIDISFKDKSEKGKTDLQELLTNIDSKVKSNSKNFNIKYSDKYIQLYPKEGWGYVYRATYLSAKNNFNLALKNMSLAISLEPENFEFYKQRAKIYVDRRRFNKRLKFKYYDSISERILASLELDKPGSKKKVFPKDKDYKLAVADYEKAVQILLKSKSRKAELSFITIWWDIHDNLDGAIYANKDYNWVINLLDKFIQIYPYESYGYKHKADYLEDKGDINAAIESLSKAIELSPEDVYYNNKRVTLLIKVNSKESLDKALIDISRIIKIDPKDYDNYSTQSEIYKKQGNISAAIESLKKAIEISETNIKNELDRKLHKTLLEEYEEKIKELQSEKVNKPKF